MLTAQKCLEIARKRGEANQEINRVYRMLKCKELYLLAYGKLSTNQGALTPGTDPEDTVDGMSMKRIDAIIDKLDKGCYEWKPSRRTYIEKKNSTKKRPLGMPSWNDKLLQEVMRMILEAYYEPQFRECSHGFRPNRGCHTALAEIKRKWRGTRWFIETDIKGCFDNINHAVLLEILGRKVKDERFLKLLKGMLRAGYMENSVRYETYSGTPQGGVLSPLLANIVLSELDKYIENELMPRYNIGKKKSTNPEYRRLLDVRIRAKKQGLKSLWDEAGKEMRNVPSKIGNDPNFKRLRYVRYADDSILGLDGSKEDAEEIKRKLGEFLRSLKLEMSESKTLITHAKDEKARFLNYFIGINWENTKQTVNSKGVKARSINGDVVLEIPSDVYNTWKAKVHKRGEIRPRAEVLNHSDYDIISTYEVELQGLINYYALAHNVRTKMMSLRFFWQKSLVRTLAGKHKTSTAKIYKKYHYRTNNGRNTIALEIKRKDKKPLIAVFGKKPIERKDNAILDDNVKQVRNNRTQLVERLLADECELCGSNVKVQTHHIKKLKDLKKKWKGRKEKPMWVKKMIAIRRKTLVVCTECHRQIHGGTYDEIKLD